MLIGTGMMSRGEVALVIAAAGLAAGAVGPTVFSASILMTLVTTIVTPFALKLISARPTEDDEWSQSAAFANTMAPVDGS